MALPGSRTSMSTPTTCRFRRPSRPRNPSNVRAMLAIWAALTGFGPRRCQASSTGRFRPFTIGVSHGQPFAWSLGGEVAKHVGDLTPCRNGGRSPRDAVDLLVGDREFHAGPKFACQVLDVERGHADASRLAKDPELALAFMDAIVVLALGSSCQRLDHRHRRVAS